MVKGKYIAKSSIHILAKPEELWKSLVNPEDIKKYMFGSDVVTDWKVGHPIIWKGKWQGQTFEDHGEILQFEKPSILKFSYFSKLSGLEDKAENYNNVQFEIEQQTDGSLLTITQDNISDADKQKHSEENWDMVLKILKDLVELKK